MIKLKEVTLKEFARLQGFTSEQSLRVGPFDGSRRSAKSLDFWSEEDTVLVRLHNTDDLLMIPLSNIASMVPTEDFQSVLVDLIEGKLKQEPAPQPKAKKK